MQSGQCGLGPTPTSWASNGLTDLLESAWIPLRGHWFCIQAIRCQRLATGCVCACVCVCFLFDECVSTNLILILLSWSQTTSMVFTLLTLRKTGKPMKLEYFLSIASTVDSLEYRLSSGLRRRTTDVPRPCCTEGRGMILSTPT